VHPSRRTLTRRAGASAIVLRHLNATGQITPVTAGSDGQTKRDATFTIVNGLASRACYSFQTKTGLFLRHRDYRLRVDANTGDAAFRGDATFCARGTSSRSSAQDADVSSGYR
jgi:Alpha-L-arabinofuranosidase B (ABFB) domain